MPEPGPDDTIRIDLAEVEKAAREEAERAAAETPPPASRRRINFDFTIERSTRRDKPPK